MAYGIHTVAQLVVVRQNVIVVKGQVNLALFEFVILRGMTVAARSRFSIEQSLLTSQAPSEHRVI